MYATKKNNKDIDFELKIITQYPDHLKTNLLASQIIEEKDTSSEDDEDSDDERSDSDSDDDSIEDSHIKMA